VAASRARHAAVDACHRLKRIIALMHLEQKPPVGTPPDDPFAAAQLRGLIMGFRLTLLIHVAAKLGLADQLGETPRTAEHLARGVGADPESLKRVLRALASIGIFAETADGDFISTPLGGLLRTDAPGSLRALAVLYGEDWLWRAYGRLLASVRTGRPGFEDVHGVPFYRFLEMDRAAAATFDEAMAGYSVLESEAILEAYDFSTVHRVVDVGGGHGGLLAALLAAHPHLTGTVLDRESAVSGAVKRFGSSGVGARAAAESGDFFTAVTPGGDLYLLKSVLHNWDDAHATKILRRCREAMPAGSRLLVIERLLPPGNAPSEAKLFDISMLVVLGGRERTESEYRRLLRGAGLELRRCVPTRSPLTLFEAVTLR
jgi:hypothetical protein